MDNNYLAYAAGFFDGEGSVSIACNETPGEKIARGTPGKIYQKFSLVVGVSNTRRFILEEFQAIWGGHVYAQKRYHADSEKPCYTWRLNGKYSKPFLTEILPYVRLKRREIQIAIEFASLPRSWNREKRIELRQALLNLNDSRAFANRENHRIIKVGNGNSTP